MESRINPQIVTVNKLLADTWAEHERQHNCFTRSGGQLEVFVLSLAHKPPVVTHRLSVQWDPMLK